MNPILAATIIVIVAAVVITLGARGRQRRRDRQSRARQLQQQIAAALARDPAMTGVSVQPQVHVGTDDRVVVELRGEAPSTWHRYAARRAVDREVRSLGIEAAIADRTTNTVRARTA
ncbi:MAG: hypothetical protein DMD91_20865 [Candidatus Rokuibacteriota bacterium]|nr:MAG: hypothetical protein DMD91_20865 [Candidatus Rokubacteria bacterium]